MTPGQLSVLLREHRAAHDPDHQPEPAAYSDPAELFALADMRTG